MRHLRDGAALIAAVAIGLTLMWLMFAFGMIEPIALPPQDLGDESVFAQGGPGK